jgi:hypothetical protein
MQTGAQKPLVGKGDSRAGTASLAGRLTNEQVTGVGPRQQGGEIGFEILPALPRAVRILQCLRARERGERRSETTDPAHVG